MSIKTSELIKAFATQTGVDTENEEFKAFISNQSLDVEIPSSAYEKISKGLMTMDSAKNNPEVASYFKVKALSGVDNMLTKQLKELELDDATLNEVLAEKDTYKKVQKMLELTPKQLEAKLKTQFGDNVKGKEEYVAKIAELSKKINEEQNAKLLMEQEYAGKLTEKDKYLEQFQVQHYIQHELGNYNLITSIPKEDLKVLINEKLKAQPYVLKLVDGKPLPFQKENPELEAHGSKGRMSLKDVLDTVVAPYLERPKDPVRSTTTAPNGAVSRHGRSGIAPIIKR